jgi:hypothetical protein
VAEAIEALFPDKLEENTHRLAQHYEASGDDERAGRYSEMAGDVAVGLSAYLEGAAHYDRAVAAEGRRGAPNWERGRLVQRRAEVLALAGQTAIRR